MRRGWRGEYHPRRSFNPPTISVAGCHSLLEEGGAKGGDGVACEHAQRADQPEEEEPACTPREAHTPPRLEGEDEAQEDLQRHIHYGGSHYVGGSTVGVVGGLSYKYVAVLIVGGGEVHRWGAVRGEGSTVGYEIRSVEGHSQQTTSVRGQRE